MPAAMIYETDPNSQRARLIDEAYDKERRERKARIDKNWAYYTGQMKANLRDDGTGVNDNVTLPLIGQVIDKSVSITLGVDDAGAIEGVTFEVVSPTPQETGGLVNRFRGMFQPQPQADPAQAYLDMVLQANRKNLLLHNLFMNASLAGHAFVLIQPDAINKDGVLLPRLVNMNPATVNVFWDELDAETVIWYRVESLDRTVRWDYVRGDVVNAPGRWLIYKWGRESEFGKWQAVDEQQWFYEWPPIVDWQNLPVSTLGGYYGRDDIGTLGQLNDAINFSVSNMQRIQKHHAHPKTIITGGMLERNADGAVEDGPSRLLEFPNPEVKVYNLEMQSDGGGALALMQFLQRQLFNAAREVDPTTVADKLGDLTNFGLRVMYQDSLAKRQQKWLSAAEGLETVCQRVLELAGFGLREVRVIPPEALPADPIAQAQSISMDVEKFGLSKDTALARRGYDPDEEAAKRELERGEQVAAQDAVTRADAFAQIAEMGRAARRNTERM